MNAAPIQTVVHTEVKADDTPYFDAPLKMSAKKRK